MRQHLRRGGARALSIPGKLVRLRAVEQGDLPLLHAWANDEALWANLGGWRFPSSLASTQEWFDAQRTDVANLRFLIEHREDQQVVGTANLVKIDWKNRHAEHGMLLGDPRRRRQGLGRDTVMAMMRYGFEELGLERLDSDVIEYNDASLRLYLGRCGWREEGRQRRWHYRGGRFWDRILIGVTRADYDDLIQSSRYWNP